jgi:hypothetical protein
MATNTTYTLTPAAGQASAGSPQRAVGKVVFDATAITAADSVTILVGFKPRRVRWVNMTDRVEGEWFEGMAANGCLKTVAAGTRTLEVSASNGGITVGEKGFSVLQNATLALILASKDCYYEAWS